MKTLPLPGGGALPAFGLGTWNVGDDPAARADEIAALRLGLDAGATLIDTAEMYGDGRSESLVGEAIVGRRDEVFLVSKVYPHNASMRSMAASCEASLKRLRTDRIDLYLLHWRGGVPLAETVRAFEALQRAGKIVRWGVSNLDCDDLEELAGVPGGAAVAVDQVLYNLGRRGVEWNVLPWLRQHGVPLMAYSPIEQGRLLKQRGLADLARRLGATPAQVALAWLLAQDGVCVIPKTSRPGRVKENLGALDLTLDDAARAELDRLFPPPRGPSSLAML